MTESEGTAEAGDVDLAAVVAADLARSPLFPPRLRRPEDLERGSGGPISESLGGGESTAAFDEVAFRVSP